MQEGYVSDESVRKSVDMGEFEITTFQGEHCGEYVVKEVNSGECRLFRKGILELSWKEKKGKRVGEFTVFEKGRALRKESWDSLLSHEEHRYVENWKGKPRMVIRKGDQNRVVYRGDYDNDDSLKRDGEGYAYDEESGCVLVHGVWKNDELFQILQEFENESEMIEYEVVDGIENVSVLNRRPVYEGGYMFDESVGKYVRCGKGNVICVTSGLAISESGWLNGQIQDSVKLFGGWYVRGREEDSLRDLIIEVHEKKAEIHNEVEWNSLDRYVNEIVVSSNCCNESTIDVFDLSALKYLKRIEIGDNCFEQVSTVNMSGWNELESVVIGENSFTRKKNGADNDPNRQFYLKNCPSLKELRMGRYSFSDYSVIEIENVDALEVIEMGDLNYWSCNFYHASLELKSVLIHSK